MMRKPNLVRVRFVLFTFLTLIFNVFHAYAQWDQHAKISLKQPSVTAAQGERVVVQALVRVDSNWHINSDKPHDQTLIATTVTAKGRSISLVKVDYPKAKDIKLGFSEQPVAVFEGESPFAVTLQVSDKAPIGKETVQIALNYQACDDNSCMTCVVIENDGSDDVESTCEPLRWESLPPGELLARLRDAGITGLGGAAFPTATKLEAARRQSASHLVLNGAECEPWICCDDALMRERAADVWLGAKVMLHVCGAERCTIAIENDKPEAIAAMQAVRAPRPIRASR